MLTKSIFRLLCINLCFILLFSSGLFAGRGSVVVGYYPSWMRTTLPADKVDFQNLTHINHAFAWPDAAGNLVLENGFIYPELTRMAHSHHVKVNLTLGGWGGSDGFSSMTADSVKRSFFIANLISFLDQNNYDGVDIDWEFPNTTSDRINLTQFVSQLRSEFDRKNPEWLITMAVSISNWNGQWFDYNALTKYVNWFNAMCYDVHGSWSNHIGHNAPLYQPNGDNDGAVDVGMAYLHNTRHIPKEQLTVGMPFYGKQFNGAGLYKPFSGNVTDYYYNQIIPLLAQGWSYHWDSFSQVPYLTNPENTRLITYDDSLSVSLKCDWIKNQGYLGGMIWAMGEDLYNGRQPLLNVVGKVLLDSTATTIPFYAHNPQKFFLVDNYPNPFNPETMIVFNLPFTGLVRFDVFDDVGKKLLSKWEGQKPTGKNKIKFKADNLSSGIYYYRIQVYSADHPPLKAIGRMILIK